MIANTGKELSDLELECQFIELRIGDLLDDGVEFAWLGRHLQDVLSIPVASLPWRADALRAEADVLSVIRGRLRLRLWFWLGLICTRSLRLGRLANARWVHGQYGALTR